MIKTFHKVTLFLVFLYMTLAFCIGFQPIEFENNLLEKEFYPNNPGKYVVISLIFLVLLVLNLFNGLLVFQVDDIKVLLSKI